MDRLAAEMSSYGANLELVPAAGRQTLAVADLPTIRKIFWRNNIVALAPFEDAGRPPSLTPGAMARLKEGLAIVVSAEALFVLTDLCGLQPDDAIASAARTAATLTNAAFSAA